MKDPEDQSSLASEAYSIVRKRILSGDIALGQVISRRKLAAELSMSFLPVSEALLRLEVEGLLESRPRAGTRVRIPSPEDVRGHYVVREALEVQAAMRFATASTQGERAELRKLAVRVDALSTQADRPLYLSVHHKLHARVAQYARCPALLEAIEKTHALSSIWFSAMQQPTADDNRPIHQDFVEDLCCGDSVRAADAVREHLVSSQQRAMDFLQPYFKLRRATGRTFYRSDKKLRKQSGELAQLH